MKKGKTQSENLVVVGGVLGCCLIVIFGFLATKQKSEAFRPEQYHTTVVESVRFFSSTTTRVRGSGGDALTGAVVGGVLFGAPTAGAIVGASGGGGSVSSEAIDGCQFSTLIAGRRLYYQETDVFSQEEIRKCALLSSGDVIQLVEYTRCPYDSTRSPDPSVSKYAWGGRCLRAAL